MQSQQLHCCRCFRISQYQPALAMYVAYSIASLQANCDHCTTAAFRSSIDSLSWSSTAHLGHSIDLPHVESVTVFRLSQSVLRRAHDPAGAVRSLYIDHIQYHIPYHVTLDVSHCTVVTLHCIRPPSLVCEVCKHELRFKARLTHNGILTFSLLSDGYI